MKGIIQILSNYQDNTIFNVKSFLVIDYIDMAGSQYTDCEFRYNDETEEVIVTKKERVFINKDVNEYINEIKTKLSKPFIFIYKRIIEDRLLETRSYEVIVFIDNFEIPVFGYYDGDSIEVIRNVDPERRKEKFRALFLGEWLGIDNKVSKEKLIKILEIKERQIEIEGI